LFPELGKTSLSVRDILNLKVGDIIKLNKRVNEEIEIFIGKKGSWQLGQAALRVKKPSE